MADYTYAEGASNSLEAIKLNLTEITDEIVAAETVTSYMTPNPALFQATQRAGEFLVPTIDVDGLAEYSRQNGYQTGAATLSFETYKCTHDRGRSFALDGVDVMETGGLANATAVLSEFIRLQVVPEVDATRLSTCASLAVTDGYTASTTASKSTLLSDIMTGIRSVKDGLRLRTTDGIKVHVNTDYMDALEQSSEYTRTKDISAGIRRLDTGVEMVNGAEIVETPADYMRTELTYGDGFTPAGTEVVALVVAPNVANGLIASQVANIFPRGVAQGIDGSKIEFRLFHDCIVLKNKTAGLYALTTASA